LLELPIGLSPTDMVRLNYFEKSFPEPSPTGVKSPMAFRSIASAAISSRWPINVRAVRLQSRSCAISARMVRSVSSIASLKLMIFRGISATLLFTMRPLAFGSKQNKYRTNCKTSIPAGDAHVSYTRYPDRLTKPMTRGQADVLRALSIEAYQPKQFAEDLTADEAALRIEALRREIALADSY
jgi:hypothetical protein